jgi:hypothetical protein
LQDLNDHDQCQSLNDLVPRPVEEDIFDTGLSETVLHLDCGQDLRRLSLHDGAPHGLTFEGCKHGIAFFDAILEVQIARTLRQER